MDKRIGNLEARFKGACHYPGEIVRWFDGPEICRSYCIAIAFWEPSNEGPELKFVGNRPFDAGVDAKVFWKLCQYGQAIVDAQHKLETQTE